MDNFENFRARLKAGDELAIETAIEVAQHYWGTIVNATKHPDTHWVAQMVLGYYDMWDGQWMYETDLPAEYWRATVRIYEKTLVELPFETALPEITYYKRRLEYHLMKVTQHERRQSLHLVE